jgi:hypothetical protein
MHEVLGIMTHQMQGEDKDFMHRVLLCINCGVPRMQQDVRFREALKELLSTE